MFRCIVVRTVENTQMWIPGDDFSRLLDHVETRHRVCIDKKQEFTFGNSRQMVSRDRRSLTALSNKRKLHTGVCKRVRRQWRGAAVVTDNDLAVRHILLGEAREAPPEIIRIIAYGNADRKHFLIHFDKTN